MTKPLIGITASSVEQRGSAFGEVYVLTRKYAEGVLRAGGVPVIVPYNLDEDSLQVLFESARWAAVVRRRRYRPGDLR